MCQKLKEIHGLTPEEIVRKYLKEYSSGKINMTELLKKMGIQCGPTEFAPLEGELCLTGNDAILGIACSEGNALNILYAKKLDQYNINYVLAHELAHCCIHLPVSAEFHVEMMTREDIYSPDNSFFKFRRNKANMAKEEEADVFAANLLLPTHSLIDYLKQTPAPTIKTISDFFEVPEHLVRKKIVILNAE